jgi:glycosyltransferase involved in cell wall biosynthesis
MQVKPKITIITVVYNAKSLIEQTIKSILQQTYPFIEYIIIDGASTDGTLEIIEQYRSKIAVVRSEKDLGIYDAMNKGLKLATGDYVLFINAGDLLASPNILSSVFDKTPEADVYYGDTEIIDIQGNSLGERRLKPPASLNWRSLRFGMCVSHQSFIAKRSLCDFYNLNYKVSSDIDWVIRVLRKSRVIIHVHQTISKFLEGGSSSGNRKAGLIERFQIMVKQYGFFPTVFNHVYILLRYPLHKLFRKSMS